MARKASVRYYDSRKAYFTHYKGQQHKLAEGPDDRPEGPTYLAALQKFSELMQMGELARPGSQTRFATICELYAQHLEDAGRKGTLDVFNVAMKPAVAAFGGEEVANLKLRHVQSWLAAMNRGRRDKKGRMRAPWGATTKRIGLQQLRRVLRWSEKMGYIAANPLPDFSEFAELRARPRGNEVVITPEAYATLVQASQPHYRDLFAFFWETGCRPAEACAVEARYFHPADSCIVYPAVPRPGDFLWKCAKTTGRDRVIYLSPVALEVVERRARLYPSGPLFRTRYGTPMISMRISNQLRKICPELKVPHIMPYGFRHTYATRWLLNGGSIKLLADLLGTSVTMLERHYAHLTADRHRVRDIMLSVMGQKGD